MSILDDLTALEVAQAEKACGMSYASMADRDVPKIALLGAIAWVHKDREPEFKLSYLDFMKTVKAEDISDYVFPDDEEDEAGAVARFPGADAEQSGGLDDAGSDGGAGGGEGEVRAGDGGPAE